MGKRKALIIGDYPGSAANWNEILQPRALEAATVQDIAYEDADALNLDPGLDKNTYLAYDAMK